jgi:hypothetical protein
MTTRNEIEPAEVEVELVCAADLPQSHVVAASKVGAK